MRLRKDGQPDRRYGNKPRGNCCEPYTWDRHARYLAIHKPNPQHVAKLKEGIALMRQMLESVSIGRGKP